MRRISALTCFVAALVLGAACRGGGGAPTATIAPEATPAPAPVASPTAAPASATTLPSPPTPTSETTGQQILSFLLPIDAQVGDIRDYRLRYVNRMTVEGEQLPPNIPAELLLWDFTMEAVIDPPATRTVMRSAYPGPGTSATPAAELGFEMIQIGDTAWIKSGDRWLPMTQMPPQDPKRPLEDLAQLFARGPAWDRVGTETVNGFATTHYRYESSSPDAAIWASVFGTAMLASSVELTDVQVGSVTFDAYLTDDDLLVRGIIRAVASGRLGGNPVTMTQEQTYDLEGVNLGITIEAPQVETRPVDVPLPEGATHKETLLGMTTYAVSGMSVDEVVAFYQEALPANGFTIGMSSTEPGQGGLIEASKDGKTYYISIALENGEVTITVTGGNQ